MDLKEEFCTEICIKDAEKKYLKKNEVIHSKHQYLFLLLFLKLSLSKFSAVFSGFVSFAALKYQEKYGECCWRGIRNSDT